MAGFTKSLIRFGVIGGLVAGGAVVIAGPHRMAALAQQMQSKVATAIDSRIDDPIAMRAQLRDLEAKYPKRIAQVRAHLGEINEQIRQVQRDKAISERVVALARDDYAELKDLIARAESAREDIGAARTVAISFDDRHLSVDEAYRRVNSVADTVNVYQTRAADLSRDMANLQRDSSRLESLLAKLESEHAQFRAQLAQLDGQIDSIARKEKMVVMMEERRERIDELSRYQVASLDQFKAALAKRQAELDGRLESLGREQGTDDYVDRARFEVDSNSTLIEPAPAPRVEPSKVVITSESGEDRAEYAAKDRD